MVLKKRVALAACLGNAAAFLILSFGCGWHGPKEAASPPRFRHDSHAAKGITCSACHQENDEDYVAAMAANMPTYGTCKVCHGPSPDRSPYPFESEIQGHLSSESFLATPRSGDVKLSHATHAKVPVPCEKCHAELDGRSGLASPPPGHAARCESCHREKGVSPECSVCHEEIRKDRQPPSHLQAAWTRTHGRGPLHAWDNSHERSCSPCHSKGFCDDCHKVEKPASHTEFFRQRGHGIAVGIQRESCMACHQENFCVRCHREEEPRSHRNASWGGSTSQHCVSCHDLGQSRCSVCHQSTPSHSQAGPVPPPPHPNGSANCYTCHLKPPHADNRVTPCTSCHKG